MIAPCVNRCFWYKFSEHTEDGIFTSIEISFNMLLGLVQILLNCGQRGCTYTKRPICRISFQNFASRVRFSALNAVLGGFAETLPIA